MNISRFDIFRFSLPLKRPLTVGKEDHSKRKGLIVVLENDEGRTALGETSPLPGLSLESLDIAENQLKHLRKMTLEKGIPDSPSAFYDAWYPLLTKNHIAPSVRFGFETAVFGLMQTVKNDPLWHILQEEKRSSVTVNALLAGSTGTVLKKIDKWLLKGFRAFKLKVGRQTMEEDITTVREVKKIIPKDALLRLDANRAWTKEEALTFFQALSDIHIDYLEEPVQRWADLKSLITEQQDTLPLALDESLTEIVPDMLASFDSVKALVIKPTMHGVVPSLRWADQAMKQGITPVISSAFESGVGIGILAKLATTLSHADIPVGLDTLDWFEYDLLKTPIRIQDGAIKIADIDLTEDNLKKELVSPV